jgi:hypothetical protein
MVVRLAVMFDPVVTTMQEVRLADLIPFRKSRGLAMAISVP